MENITEDNLNKFLNKVKKEWENDNYIDKSDLVSSELETMKLHSKYMNFLSIAKRNAYKIENYYNSMRGKKSKYYRGKMSKAELDLNQWQPFQYALRTKTEVDEVMTFDVDLNSIVSMIAANQIIIDYCEQCIYCLKQRTWQIKNIIEIRKFEAGL